MAEVEVEFAISLRNRRDPHYAEGNGNRCLVTRPSIQRKPCWGVSDQVDMIDTVLRGWICPPIYVISRPDMSEHCGEGEDHVFDGAHKLEAVFDFIDDKFVFKAKGDKFAELTGKRFSEMPREIQDRIKKYRFHINHVDAETAGSPDELRILWERVNKAGKKLNRFELDLPLIAPLLEQVLHPCSEQFLKNKNFFPKAENKRGDLEQRMQLMLALTEIEWGSTSSQTNLVSRWHKERLGATMAERTATIAREAAGWRATLDRAFKMLVDLEQLNLFCDDDGDSIIQTAHQNTELPFVLARLARRFQRIEDFRSQKRLIAETLKEEIFGKSITDLTVELGCTARNGTYQQRLLKYVDRLVSDLVDNVQPRLFTKAQIKQKMAMQSGVCTLCTKKILAHHLFDGDHVIEWSKGGGTTLENLEVVHRLCHQEKTGAAYTG